MRILVFRGGALGDFILTLPFLEAIRRAHPDAHLTLVGNRRAASLALEVNLLSECISQDDARWASLYSTDGIPGPLREWLESFDEIICFLPDPDGAVRSLLFGLKGPRVHCHPPLPDNGPVAAHFCSVLPSLGIRTTTTPSQALWQRNPRASFIAFHPGSGSSRKNWPVECWNRLLENLPLPSVLIASAQDTAFLNGLTFKGDRCIDASLSEVSRLLGRAAFYIGHDTGVSHLAAAVGTPSLLLYGPTDPAQWAPLGDHVHVLRAQPLQSLSVTTVLGALQAQLALTRGV